MGARQLMWIWVRYIFFGIGFCAILPLYRHVYGIHVLIRDAMESGVWCQLPPIIPTWTQIEEAIVQAGKVLGMPVIIKKHVATFQVDDPIKAYTLLHSINQIPTVMVKGVEMKGGKGKISITCHPRESGDPEDQAAQLGPRFRGDDTVGTFHSPRYHYVNALTSVDGHQQFWVNGKPCNTKRTCPLYHTLDSKTGKITKGDLRPKLHLVVE